MLPKHHKRAPATPAGIKRRPAIFYADRNPILRRFVRDVLELSGYRVEDCSDGVYARAMLECNKYYDLLIFDNELPDITGLELTRHARRLEHLRQTPIIIISYDDHADDARRANQLLSRILIFQLLQNLSGTLRVWRPQSLVDN